MNIEHKNQNESAAIKKEFNPIWALVGMGILMGLIFAFELFGPKH